LKTRAADARAVAKATRAWSVAATAAAAGTRWRSTSSWIQQADGVRCAEFTHVSTGKHRMIRLATDQAIETLRSQLVEE